MTSLRPNPAPPDRDGLHHWYAPEPTPNIAELGLDLRTLDATVCDDEGRLVLMVTDNNRHVVLHMEADHAVNAVRGALRLASAASEYAGRLAVHLENLAVEADRRRRSARGGTT